MNREKLGSVTIAVLTFVLLAGAGSALLLKNQTTNNLSQFINWSPKVSFSPITTPEPQQSISTPAPTPIPQLQQQSTNTPEPSPLFGRSGERRILIAFSKKLSYSVGEAITVFISNDTPKTIWVMEGPTGGSYCKILMIEQKNGSNWQEIGTCGSAMPTSVVDISPVSSIKETFSFPSDIGSPSNLPAGTYRLRLDYYLSNPFGSSNPTVEKVYSQEFRVF